MGRMVEKLTQDADSPRLFVIVSLPGMGKTEVAIKIAHNLLEKKKSVIFIFIEKQYTLADTCGEILRRITGKQLSESHDLVSLTKEKLRNLKFDIIVILDNTEDVQGEEFDVFAGYVIRFAPKVKLIVTTRKNVGLNSLNIYKEVLEPLDPDSSVLLLQKSIPNCHEYAPKLSQLCGGIPLLLVSCVELLKDDFNPDVLIRYLQENPIQLLKTCVKDVYDQLGIFLRNMHIPNLLQLDDLVRVSVFPSAFSLEDIKIFFDDDLQLETVKTRMVRCSLVQKMVNKKYTLHPLVREYCRTERKVLEMEEVGKAAQEKFNRHFIEMLKTLSKRFVTKDSAMQAISSFKKAKVNIMDALWNCLQEKCSANEKEFVVDVVNSTEVLDFLSKVISPPAECLKLYETCYGVAKASGDKRRISDSLNALGFRHLCNVGHRKLDEDKQSFEMFKKAYDIRMELPEEQQNCLAQALTMCKLGLCYSLKVRT